MPGAHTPRASREVVDWAAYMAARYTMVPETLAHPAYRDFVAATAGADWGFGDQIAAERRAARELHRHG